MIQRSLVLLAAAVAALSLVSCGGAADDGGSGAVPEPSYRSEGTSLLLVTLDTLRADRLGCYGHAGAETPALDELASDGVLFEQALCQVPQTYPSHTSLLTGTYPISNGVRINGPTTLGGELETLAEAFRTRGYRTGAFIAAAVLDEVFGLARGFEVYDDHMGEKKVYGEELEERSGDKVVDSALAWLEGRPEVPFFAWVHLFDAHDPYDPPSPYRERFDDPYDGEIAFVDAQVRRLIDWLEARGLKESTLVVVVGDHGEAFGEHGENSHGMFIYDSTMLVPLLFVQPGTLPGGLRVPEPVGVVDVFPTVFELLGWELPEEVEGVSRAAACRSGRVESPSPVYGESEYGRLGFGWAPLKSWTTERWKYIEAPQPELYDRSADPDELENLVEEYPDVAARLREELRAKIATMEPRAGGEAADPETLARLQSLGYVAPSRGAPTEELDLSGRDPKEMREVYRDHLEAIKLAGQRDFPGIIALLEPRVKASPESDTLYLPLAVAYLETGRPQDAEMAFRASLRQMPDDRQRLWGLGESLLRQRKFEDAIAAFEAAISVSPRFVDVLISLGNAYMETGRVEDGTRCFRDAAEAAPSYPLARDLYGEALAREGRFEPALEQYETLVEIAPDYPLAYNKLGGTLFVLGRPEEAARALRQALEHNPKSPHAHRTLWRALMLSGDAEGAIAALRDGRETLPDDATVTYGLAWVLATTRAEALRDPDEALRLVRETCDEQGGPRVCSALLLDAAAAAHASLGDFETAIRVARRAATQAGLEGKTGLAQAIGERVRLYESGQPFLQ
jgi:arylsulfatase A-like enzyme/Flp pilus assembly protein TadD